jgi:hypothetical protein
MLQSSVELHNPEASSALFNKFFLTTEIIRGNFPPVPANLPGRPFAGRHTREDTNA